MTEPGSDGVADRLAAVRSEEIGREIDTEYDARRIVQLVFAGLLPR